LIKQIVHYIKAAHKIILDINNGENLKDRYSQEYLQHIKSIKSNHESKSFEWNISAVKHSIKISLSVLILIYMATYFSWPAGIQAIIAVVVMTAQPNLGKAHLRFHLRFLGVFVGGLIATIILYLLWPEHPLMQLRLQIKSSLTNAANFSADILNNNINQLRPLLLNIDPSFTSNSVIYNTSNIFAQEYLV